MQPSRRFVVLTTAVVSVLLTACGATPSSTPTVRSSHLGTPTASSGRPVYAALGASETYGIGADPMTRGYAYQVRDAIGATGFADLGIPGATLGNAYQTEVTGAVALHPTVCTTFFGVNDIRAGVPRDAFLTDLHDLVITLRRSGCRVFTVGLPDLALIPAVARVHRDGLAVLTADWNAGIADVTVQGGGVYLSLTKFSTEIAAHPEAIAADGLHPSTAGHTRLAAVIVDALRTAGAMQ